MEYIPIMRSSICNISTQHIRDIVKRATGLRLSPRLQACADILWVFLPFGRFGRLEVLSDCVNLKKIHHPKVLTRALRDMEMAGIIVRGESRPHHGGGAIFHINVNIEELSRKSGF
jgi:hypothetical protein